MWSAHDCLSGDLKSAESKSSMGIRCQLNIKSLNNVPTLLLFVDNFSEVTLDFPPCTSATDSSCQNSKTQSSQPYFWCIVKKILLVSTYYLLIKICKNWPTESFSPILTIKCNVYVKGINKYNEIKMFSFPFCGLHEKINTTLMSVKKELSKSLAQILEAGGNSRPGIRLIE